MHSMVFFRSILNITSNFNKYCINSMEENYILYYWNNFPNTFLCIKSKRHVRNKFHYLIQLLKTSFFFRFFFVSYTLSPLSCIIMFIEKRFNMHLWVFYDHRKFYNLRNFYLLCILTMHLWLNSFICK